VTTLTITSNYSAVANIHTLQITTAHAKYFPACSVVSSSCLVTASNNNYSFASWLKFYLNGGSLPNAYYWEDRGDEKDIDEVLRDNTFGEGVFEGA
jgi:hypothetical protein